MKQITYHRGVSVFCLLIISLFSGCFMNNKGDHRSSASGYIVDDTSRVMPLSKAFAHNDYEHENPLFDALANGFTVVEADVHLIEGELYVTHDPPASLESVSTLRALYLDPLKKIIRDNGGFVYPGYDAPVYLMIDIKTDGESTYAVLRRQLLEYVAILSSSQDTGTEPKPVRVFISGNRPVQLILDDTLGLAGVDGRLEDLEQQYSAGFMPMVSENFSKVTDWNGIDPIPAETFERLKSLSSKVHQQGKTFRLWGVPENEYAWKMILEAGIDYLCTDDLWKAKSFLLEYNCAD
jgi:glycerophosphoryl diester phosphodiesterase